ncbi:MAG: hypothetical protein O9266_07260 [Porphyrobacter sp.]|jgi:hypothetical protein|nr:hypothetical protein [Porphyrobacter sp.]
MRAERLAGMMMLGAALALPACKPPPTDVGSARAANLPVLPGPSRPIASPDTTDAVWAASGGPMRLVYGVPGQPVLLAVQCDGAGTANARLRITRHAPADHGAGALLALIGNGWIGRFPVDATRVRGKLVWQGAAPASRREWDALKPEREATVTVPGAGLLRLNPSPLPMQLVEACRKVDAPASPIAPA